MICTEEEEQLFGSVFLLGMRYRVWDYFQSLLKPRIKALVTQQLWQTRNPVSPVTASVSLTLTLQTSILCYFKLSHRVQNTYSKIY